VHGAASESAAWQRPVDRVQSRPEDRPHRAAARLEGADPMAERFQRAFFRRCHGLIQAETGLVPVLFHNPRLRVNPLPDLPSEEFRGFNKELGFRMVEWSPDHAVLTLEVEPRHLNRSGIVHGGILATMIDAAGSYTGVYPLEPGRTRRCITVSMTTSFLGQTKSGIITCTAHRMGGGKTIFTATAEVRSEDGTLLAIGQGIYRYIAEIPR